MLVYIDGGVKRHHLDREQRAGYIVVAGDIEYIARVEVQTNNQAEYLALIKTMELAIQREDKKLEVMSDSELLLKQVRGEYKVKSKDLKGLVKRVRDLSRSFEEFSLLWIPRERNLAGKILEKKGLT